MSGTSPEFVTEIVRAGAGAGKTYRLTEKVLQIASQYLQASNSLPKLVITTFTKKATEELRERITRRALEFPDARVLELVKSRQYLQISTIHGVLSTFLRSYGHLAGLESEFTVVDGIQSRLQAKRVLRDLIKAREEKSDILSSFSFEEVLDACLRYRSAIMTHPDAKVFRQTDYDQAVADLFRPHLQKLRTVIQAILSEVGDGQWIEYLNGLLAAAADHNGIGDRIKDLGRRPQYRNEPFSEHLKNELSDTVEDIKKLSGRSYLDRAHWAKLESNTIALESLGAQFTQVLNEIKKESGSFDSEDLELFSLDVLRQEPSLGGAFAAEWNYWLIDEYQDTSPCQVEILDRLIGKAPCFYVGDPQQSIYLFRGARSEVFDQREASVVASGGRKDEMMMNRRSRPELLFAINDRIAEMGRAFTGMTPRSQPDGNEYAPLHIFEVPAEDETPYLGLANQVLAHLQKGGRADDFCVLSRTNSILNAVALQFESLGIPCAVHSATGFFSRREILDLMSLYKFLWNPFDSLNLVRLLRSPWFFISDIDLTKRALENQMHLWPHLRSNMGDHPVVKRLSEATDLVQTLGLSEAFLRALMESHIVDLSHWHDPTGRRESNIWKLVLWLKEAERQPGFRPASVLRQFDRALRGHDEEADAAASKEPNRVNLMTIHKSKGLSFKNVILPNMEKVPRFSSARAHEQILIFDEQTKKLSSGARIDSKLVHSPSAHFSLTNIEEREREETKRLLYVAMTRAEESLLFHAVKGERGFAKDSWAGLLNVWSPEIFDKKPTKYRVHFFRNDDSKLDGVQRKATEQKPVRGLFSGDALGVDRFRFSVSSLLEDSKISGSEIKSRDLKSTETFIRAPSFGTSLHEALELLKYSDLTTVLDRIKRYAGPEYSKYQKAIEHTLSLGEPPIRELIQTGQVEWGFQLMTQKGVLEGQIDLWGQVGDTVWVVDYKSGNPTFVEKAVEQLGIYAYALSKAFGAKKFKLAVVFPLSQSVEVRELSDLGAIARKYNL